jgi:hypothetical protein
MVLLLLAALSPIAANLHEVEDVRALSTAVHPSQESDDSASPATLKNPVKQAEIRLNWPSHSY